MSTGIWGSRLARYAIAVLAATTFAAVWLVFATSGAEAKGPKPPKPAISELTASPSTVPGGGATTVTAAVSGAETCTLASTTSRPVEGLPLTASCSSGSFSQVLNMPDERREKKPVKFKLKLIAVGKGGKGGKARALVVVMVSPRRYSDTPTAVESISDATQIGVGGSHVCAVLSGGGVSCWGRNVEGQLFNETPRYDNDKPLESPVTGATQVAGGGDHSCATLSSGHVECSGSDQYGQLGDGKAGAGSGKPVEAVGLTEAVEVAAGLAQTCALLADGHVECWGLGLSGELGNGHNANAYVPVEVQGISDATQITAGPDGAHACALLATGHVECWGSNEYGQLGNGSTTNSDVPVEVLGVSAATHVSASYGDTCALLSNGHIDCWGNNQSGQLGDGSTTSSHVPLEVVGITDATSVAAGGAHSCAGFATGHVECWGGNGYGELGNGTVTDSPTPVEVLGLDEVTSLSAGGVQSCALLASGSIECWGDNGEGELGNGTFI